MALYNKSIEEVHAMVPRCEPGEHEQSIIKAQARSMLRELANGFAPVIRGEYAITYQKGK